MEIRGQWQPMNDGCFFFKFHIQILLSFLVCLSSTSQLTEGIPGWLCVIIYLPTNTFLMHPYTLAYVLHRRADMSGVSYLHVPFVLIPRLYFHSLLFLFGDRVDGQRPDHTCRSSLLYTTAMPCRPYGCTYMVLTGGCKTQ